MCHPHCIESLDLLKNNRMDNLHSLDKNTLLIPMEFSKILYDCSVYFQSSDFQ